MAGAQPAHLVRRYRAFISYAHEDARWAKWLQDTLETFKTPRELVDQGFPDRIGPLFRDEDELPVSSDLSDEIKAALESSDFLLVVCSPATQVSEWVAREIELFASLGGAARIVPILAAGDRIAGYPAALRSLLSLDGKPIEPIAADLRAGHERSPPVETPFAQLKHFAVLKIAACLIGCRFDDLRKRDEERVRAQARKTRRILASITAVLLVAGWLTYKRWNEYVTEELFRPWTFAQSTTSKGTPFCALVSGVHNKHRGQNVIIKGYKQEQRVDAHLYKDAWNFPEDSLVDVMFDFMNNKPLPLAGHAVGHIVVAEIPTQQLALFLVQLAERPMQIILTKADETWLVPADGAKAAVEQWIECMR